MSRKALIFAAGLGTRLRPWTNDRPKALVDVAGKPMLQHVLDRVAAAGFDDITVNVHHHGQMVIDYLDNHPMPAVAIHISDERDLLLDTGGGILKARQWLDSGEPFLVHNADILTDLDLDAMYRHHIDSGAVATLLVKHRDTQRYLLLDGDDRLCGWTNIATGELRPDTLTTTDGLSRWAFGGVHVVSPALFPLLEQYAQQTGPKFGITPFYVDCCSHHDIGGYHPRGEYRWLDVGKPDTLQQARLLYAENAENSSQER